MTRHPVLTLLLSILIPLLGSAAPTLAQLAEPGASNWVDKPHSRMRLVSAVTAVGTAETLTLGLEVELKDHWKIYWRSPGDAGYPPEMDWTGSVNLTKAAFQWPVPSRFSVLGIETVGYQGHVILPISAKLTQPGDPLILNAKVDYLICSDICVPDQGSFSLMLPPGPAKPSPQAHSISQYLAQVPKNGTSHGLSVTEAVIEEGGVVRVAVSANPPLSQPDLFVEPPPGLAFGPPSVTLTDGGRSALLRAPLEGEAPLLGQTISALVADGIRGVETTIDTATLAEPGAPLTAAAAGRAPIADLNGGGEAPALWTMLGLALVGGLILNLMPCVLPVLSLKILGLVGHGGGAPRRARLSFLATSAGILASFLALAGAAIALKSMGAAVGWGIQFQHPLFLTGMVILLTLFAANLWGLFEIPLPGILSNLGGQGAEGGGGSLVGAFATGAFATLLATPCSAPFLGTAVGFALAGGSADTLGIFSGLGLGMALPYLVVAAFPRLATRLPRPGAWMVKLRWVLGLALGGTAVWLLTVFAVQVGWQSALAVGLAMAVTVTLLALGARAPTIRKLALGGIAFLFAGSAALALRPPPPPSAAVGSDAQTASIWQPWSAEDTTRLVAEGKTVFVDVTADWCVTCLVNKAAVLDRGPVAALLAGENVVALRADWTRPDPAIAAYLASFGRYGIPFNAVYGPHAPNGIALPELLTDGAVMEAVERASSPTLAEK
ncbi:protein-disulfide reductase DsbD family protein [Rhodospirillum sp. A1_3_36]|uniref:protein-disulfide reductase DsbD family protein n=1 Tax=Rhodospirillum sp. A1_3_36 TaxID=3391666 RepID=UPI0039A6CA2F